MTTAPADAREKLVALLDETFTAEQCKIASAFGEPPFKTPPEGWHMSRVFADAILAAFPSIAAPAQDATETARKLLIEIGHCGIFDGHKGREFLVNDEHVAHIAAAITAAEARVREECAKIADWCERECDGDENQAKVARAIASAIRAGGGR